MCGDGAAVLICLSLLLYSAVGRSSDSGGSTSPFDFRIAAPLTWNARDPSDAIETLKRVELTDPRLQEALKGTRPVVSLSRYRPGEHVGLNPSVHVYVSKTGDISAAQLLRTARDTESKILSDYKIVEDVTTTDINGLQAATYSVTFTTKYKNGMSYRTFSRTWAIQGGPFMYIIGASGPEDPAPELQNDFNAIISTFRFTDD